MSATLKVLREVPAMETENALVNPIFLVTNAMSVSMDIRDFQIVTHVLQISSDIQTAKVFKRF